MKKLLIFGLFLLTGFVSAASLDLSAFTGSGNYGAAAGTQTAGQSGVLTAGNGGGVMGTQSGVVAGQVSGSDFSVPTGDVEVYSYGGTLGGSQSGGVTGGNALGLAGSAYQGGTAGATTATVNGNVFNATFTP